jgi:hypothetical protein
MNKTLFGSTLVVCFLLTSFVSIAQDRTKELQDYSRVLANGDGKGLTLTLVHINDYTAPLLFQPPTLYAMRSRAREATMLYVQGTADHDLELDTTNFTIDQASEKNVTATPTSITNFSRGKVKVAKSARVDGVLTFAKLIDPTKPFTVHHAKDEVEFRFNDAAVKAMKPAVQP